jgi:preprotein translocase subunit SecE
MSESQGSTATPERPDSGGSKAAKKSGRKGGKPLPARIALFYRQVIAELRKVIWPTRRELITYTSVVLVFVIVIMAYVGVLDLAFGRLVLAVFGN